MAENLEGRYQEVIERLSPVFGKGMELLDLIFLIGIRESGKAPTTMSKQEKEDALHLGTCTILAQYGYYNKLDSDEDGWPHFEHQMDLPPLNEKQQEDLLKQGVADYFEGL